MSDIEIQKLRRDAHLTENYTKLRIALKRIGIDLVTQVRHTVDSSPSSPTTQGCPGLITSLWREDTEDRLVMFSDFSLTCRDNIFSLPALLPALGRPNWQIKTKGERRSLKLGDILIIVRSNKRGGADPAHVASLTKIETRHIEINAKHRFKKLTEQDESP